LKIINDTVGLIIAFLVIGLVPFIEFEYVVGQESYNVTETYYVEEAVLPDYSYEDSNPFGASGTLSPDDWAPPEVVLASNATLRALYYQRIWSKNHPLPGGWGIDHAGNIIFVKVPKTREVTKIRDVIETRTICLFEDLWIRLHPTKDSP